MAMDQPPFTVLAPKNMRHAVGPTGGAFDTGHALVAEGFDIGGVEHLRRDHGGDVLVAHRATPELLPGPVPAFRDRLVAFLLAAPAIEAGGVGAVRIETLDVGDVAIGDLGHRRV